MVARLKPPQESAKDIKRIISIFFFEPFAPFCGYHFHFTFPAFRRAILDFLLCRQSDYQF